MSLLRKAGHLDSALQLCLSAGLQDSLRLLAEEATPYTDSQVLEKCAQVFVEMGMTDKAISLLARTKRFDAVGPHKEQERVCASVKLFRLSLP